MAAIEAPKVNRFPIWVIVCTGMLGVVAIAAMCGRPAPPKPPPYSAEQKAIISAWMDKHPRDAAWIDPVRDHITAQGMLFQDDDNQKRLYLVHGLKPSQVMARTMWPFLKQGFHFREPFAGIAGMDNPSAFEYDQFGIEYNPGSMSYEWTPATETGTGSYWLRNISSVRIARELGSADEVITEECNVFESDHYPGSMMAKLVDEFGFNPKRGNETSFDPTQLLTSVEPAKKHVSEPSQFGFGVDRSEPWMDSLRSHIASKKVTPSDKDERREYELKDFKMSDVVRALRGPLEKLGLKADTSTYEKDEDMNGSDEGEAMFVPEKWNADAAKLGLVAVEAVHDEGAANIRIIELYGLPMMGPAATAKVH